jgi:hypothetical protein
MITVSGTVARIQARLHRQEAPAEVSSRSPHTSWAVYDFQCVRAGGQLHFNALRENAACNNNTNVNLTGGCAVKLTQAGLR